MKIKIRSYRVTSDENCFVVYRRVIADKGKHKGKPKEVDKRYYSSLTQALQSVLKDTMLKSKTKNVEELLEEIRVTRKLIAKALKAENLLPEMIQELDV